MMFAVGDKVRWTMEQCERTPGAMPHEVLTVNKVEGGNVWTDGRSYGIDPERLEPVVLPRVGTKVRATHEGEGVKEMYEDVIESVSPNYFRLRHYGHKSRADFRLEVLEQVVPEVGRAVEFEFSGVSVKFVGVMGSLYANAVGVDAIASVCRITEAEIKGGEVSWRYLG